MAIFVVRPGKPETPFFAPYERSNIRETIKHYHGRMTNILLPELTDQEIISLCCPPSQREKIVYEPNMDSRKLIEINWRPRNTSITFVCNSISYSSYNSFPPKMYDDNEELVQRINEWIDGVNTASRDYGRLNAVVNELIENYTKLEVRYLFPSIIALVTAGITQPPGWTEKVIIPRRKKFKHPELPLRLAIEKASETVAAAMLVKDIPMKSYSGIRMTIEYRWFHEDGFKFGNI